MSTRIEALLEQARKLAPEERAQLLDRLQDLVSPPDPDWEAAWAQECADRLAAYERGDMAAEDFEAAMKKLRAKYTGQ